MRGVLPCWLVLSASRISKTSVHGPLAKWDQVTHLSHLPTTIYTASLIFPSCVASPLSICNTPQYFLTFLFIFNILTRIFLIFCIHSCCFPGMKTMLSFELPWKANVLLHLNFSWTSILLHFFPFQPHCRLCFFPQWEEGWHWVVQRLTGRDGCWWCYRG